MNSYMIFQSQSHSADYKAIIGSSASLILTTWSVTANHDFHLLETASDFRVYAGYNTAYYKKTVECMKIYKMPGLKLCDCGPGHMHRKFFMVWITPPKYQLCKILIWIVWLRYSLIKMEMVPEYFSDMMLIKNLSYSSYIYRKMISQRNMITKHERNIYEKRKKQFSVDIYWHVTLFSYMLPHNCLNMGTRVQFE